MPLWAISRPFHARLIAMQSVPQISHYYYVTGSPVYLGTRHPERRNMVYITQEMERDLRAKMESLTYGQLCELQALSDLQIDSPQYKDNPKLIGYLKELHDLIEEYKASR